MFVMYTLIVT